MKRIMSETKKTTLLVPVNQAIIALPHKPYVRNPSLPVLHTFPDRFFSTDRHQDAEGSIEITDFKARSNADRFVMAHTLPVRPPSFTAPTNELTHPADFNSLAD
jgi:hypothetical protein